MQETTSFPLLPTSSSDECPESTPSLESPVEAPETKQENITLGIWRCPICTFDNEEGMSACDICGVLRNPLGNACSNGNKNTVDGMRKDSGASIMARSLFASLPRLIPNKPETFQLRNDNFLMEECNSFCKLGNIQGHSNELHRAFSLRKHIGPFKFDVPSPDDLVSKGLRSSKVGSKANVNKLSSSDVPSSVTEKKIAVELRSDAKSFDTSSAFISDNRHGSIGEDTHSLSNEVQSQSLSSSLNTVKSGSSKNVSARRAVSHAQYKPEKWMLPDHAEDRLTQLNLAIVGHVDSGKSTLSGKLLYLSGRISQKEMHKYEKEANLQGKGSFAFAWALDESAEERERGITMTVAVAYFDSKRYHVVLLDSPGHKDFVPNMISGATQADAAILVIDASIGSFEAGMDSTGGQTREHAQLIRSFGADQVIVAINKMDVVEYSKERFDTIKLQLGTFLRSCGFKDSTLSWVPLSAIENQNLMEAASDARLVSWYKGPPLLDAVDSLKPPARDYSKPLLMPICDVIKLQTQGQVSACGKLEAGALRSGSKVLVMPSGEMGTVRSLERDSEACAIARAGDNVAVCLLGIDGSSVMAGGVLCHPVFPVAVAKNLELKILILDVATPILIGCQLEFHIHHAKEAARVVKILSLLDPKTGKAVKKAPRRLLAKQSAVVEVALEEAVCVEEFSSCRALGRVFLRASGRTVAVGVVTRIIEDLQQQQEE
ncbi:HBS1-like protein isoform X2 [Camellia sinensis]|uniref:HBS1-like protein isoform X2 n=1 Tax=Camellia sinensis TaxID=4442 RepID=UPI001036CA62|nr:HBS1-like protein isoform X2 [Camellia sinensis]